MKVGICRPSVHVVLVTGDVFDIAQCWPKFFAVTLILHTVTDNGFVRRPGADCECSFMG
jgi:hypothetical protein